MPTTFRIEKTSSATVRGSVWPQFNSSPQLHCQQQVAFSSRLQHRNSRLPPRYPYSLSLGDWTKSWHFVAVLSKGVQTSNFKLTISINSVDGLKGNFALISRSMHFLQGWCCWQEAILGFLGAGGGGSFPSMMNWIENVVYRMAWEQGGPVRASLCLRCTHCCKQNIQANTRPQELDANMQNHWLLYCA